MGTVTVLGTLLFLALAIAYLSPGLLALLLFRPPERASTWFALAAPVAVAIQMAIETVLKIFVPVLDDWTPGVLATLVVDVALFLVVFVKRRSIPWALGDGRVLVCVAAVPLLFAIVFNDAIFHRELTSDGIETFEMAQRLGSHFLPRWPTEAGVKGLGQGLVGLAFPNAWFARTGLGDTGPRLTFLMFLGVIAAQVIALVESRRERRVNWIATASIGLSTLAAGITLGLNVSFDPYFADPANPAGAETMAVAMMLAAFVALLKRRTTIFLVAAGLAHVTLPSGMLFLLLLGASAFFVTRDRSLAARVGAAVALCVVLTLLYEKVYVPNVLPEGVAAGAGSGSMAGRMRLLIFHDFGRLAFLVIPCGILPAIFLFAWRRQDAVSRIATLIAGGMFLFFFVLATYSPHYFAPVMALALVPFWRWARTPKVEWAGLGGALAGVLLSLPWTHAVPQPYATIGKTIDIAASDASIRPFVLPATDLLQRLAYLPWDDVDPTQHLVASGLQLAHYEAEARLGTHRPPLDWVVQPEASPPEPGYQPVASQSGWTLFARPGVTIESVRDRGHPTDFQAPWYRVPREALFRGLTEKSGRYDLDLRSIFGRN
jgi:hypothetical protein